MEVAHKVQPSYEPYGWKAQFHLTNGPKTIKVFGKCA